MQNFPRRAATQVVGALKVNPAGIQWRPAQGGNVVNMRKDDVKSLEVTEVPTGASLDIQVGGKGSTS